MSAHEFARLDAMLQVFFQGETTAEYRALLIMLVYNYIKSNPDVTERKILRHFRTVHAIGGKLIRASLTCLVSPTALQAVKSWHYKDNKDVHRYRVTESDKFAQWQDTLPDSIRSELVA